MSFVIEGRGGGLRLIAVAAVAVVAATIGTACDNVTNPSTAGVDTLYATSFWSGTLASDGLGNYNFFDSSDVAVGDLDALLNGETIRGLVIFDIAAYATSDSVESATLRVDECAVSGTPFASFGTVVVDHLSPSPPSPGLYAGGTTGSNIGTISSDTLMGYHSLAVDSAAQHDVTAGLTYSTWRLRFSTEDGNANGVSDYVAFRGIKTGVCTGSSSRLPALIITTK